MNLQTEPCRPQLVDRFLNHQTSAAEQLTLEEHLEACRDCQDRLQKLTGGVRFWEKATDYLQVESEFQWHPDSTRPIDGEFGPLIVDQVLNSLAATDDPNMLGRIGGYEISGVIGCGGMGAVLKGFDPGLKRVVAIKVLAPHLAALGAARERFRREAQATAAITHDNVIEIYGVAEANGLPYLVMPCSRGTTLQKRIDDRGPLPVVEVLRIGIQVASGLAAAHQQGLVHRDVKPANILMQNGVDRLVITDFGLARAVDDASVTRTGTIAGTPQYMSPEQAQGEFVDARSDLFSLGSLLYALCAGRVPFRAATAFGVLRRITDDQPRAIREINAAIPEWLSQIICRLHAKSPAQRFQTAEEVEQLLQQCLAHIQNPQVVALPETARDPEPANKGDTSGSGKSAVPPSRIIRWLSGPLAVACLGLIVWLGKSYTDPPDIAGTWNGPGWGTVELSLADKTGQYIGTYTDTLGAEPGQISLNWSRIERRFNGSWGEGEDRSGRLSIRLVDGEIRGAWTTSRKSKSQPRRPRLADLLWQRGPLAGLEWVDPNSLPAVTAAEPTAMPDSQPAPVASGQLLTAVTSQFNDCQAKDPVGRGEPRLTDDEIVASIHWNLRTKGEDLKKSESLQQLLQIADSRIVPAQWSLQSETRMKLSDGTELDTWTVQLLEHAASGNVKYTHVIRNRAIKTRNAESSDVVVDDAAIPLGDLVQEFDRQLDDSLTFSDPNGWLKRELTNPPMTVDEAVASLRIWLDQRVNRNLGFTRKSIREVRRIVDTRRVGKGAEFDVINGYRNVGDYDFTRPTIGLRFPVDGTMNRLEIRPRFLHATPIPKVRDDQIRWGPESDDGLQIGVYPSPDKREYAVGETIVPEFYVRNNRGRITARIPWKIHFYSDNVVARDPTGRQISVDFPIYEYGPTFRMPDTEIFGEMRIKRIGDPLSIGPPSSDGDVGAIVNALPGGQVRLHFVIPNFANASAPSLKTGEVRFSVRE